MPGERKSRLDTDFSVVFYWLMATTFGWVLGWLLLPTVALLAAGFVAGAMQSAVLARRVARPWRWILATGVGWMAGVGMALAVVPPGMGMLSGAVIGMTTGTAQWAVLRSRAQRAGWWIAVSIVAWAAGLSMAPASGQVALPPLVLAGVMAAVPGGIALEILLRHPNPRFKTRPRA